MLHVPGRLILSLVGVPALLVISCELPPGTVEPGPTVAPAIPTAAPTAAVSDPSDPQADMVRRATTDAATRAGVSAADVVVVRVTEREWSDGSLGCPAPGQMYIQVITPGYLIELEAAGRRFEYHTDRGSRVVLCQGGRPAR